MVGERTRAGSRGRLAAAASAAVVVAALAGCGSVTGRRAGGAPLTTAPATSPPARSGPAASGPGALCGSRPGPGRVDKVMVIWEENKSFGSIVGSSDAPEINAVAGGCGLATNAWALTHPSLPNYLSETSGVSYARSPFDGDCSAGESCLSGAASVFAQETAAGQEWRAYAQSMPSNCDRSNSGPYAVRHNPAVYYPAVAGSCARWDVPLGSPAGGALADAVRSGDLPALSTVTPDVNNDMHDGSVAQGDRWLRAWLPLITAGPDYTSGRLAVLIVWDEGSSDDASRSHIPLLVMSASTPAGVRSATYFDGYSVLRTVEDLTGVAPLGRAAGAASLAPPFNLRG